MAYFLEQCLNSVQKAMALESAEVWVVDNCSVDESVAMVKEKFPWVKLIANTDNKGFSKANNQAMELSDCAYQLLLNPDTVIEEDTLQKIVRYMDEHPDCGGLGVRMVDGKGVFLPESKRGLPTPAVAFYKIFGISRLFPKSKTFGRYHLGYLSEFETNEVEILSGAFMLMRKKALDKVGLLDEAFFMYGEDIDLSYRIIKGGYKNVYFPETRIIHYKGESTKKSSVNYVFVFYNAMIIFARKHFSQKNARLFSFFIHLAIYFRAALALTQRVLKKVTLPLIDLVYLGTGLFALMHYWTIANIHFKPFLSGVLTLCYLTVWYVFNLLQGVYDAPVKLKKSFIGTFFGTLFILVIYGLLPKSWQFSRLFILVGTCWVMSYYFLSRLLLHFLFKKRFTINGESKNRFAIFSGKEEFQRIEQLLQLSNSKISYIHHVDSTQYNSENFAKISNEIVEVHKIDELIFAAKEISAQQIIQAMIEVQNPNVDFKIAQPESQFLIGSNSIDSAGDVYKLNFNAISETSKQRQKRFFDISCAFVFLIASPLLIWFFKNKKDFIKNSVSLFIGKVSLVGYRQDYVQSQTRLPRIKTGVLSPHEQVAEADENLKTKLNLLYAREYSILNDLSILVRYWKKIDRPTN